ncbi:MAG: response regulator transcription factor [Armatimonadetes bacterium]|nr:response regulator transcription factor [Armatimonadota bacterium]
MSDPHPEPTVTVMLVDDHEIWRGGVKSMLRRTEFAVVAEASSGFDAVEAARAARPRLALVDIRMAGGDGLDALQALRKEFPDMAVVMLTTYDNPTFMARAIAGGASGYLLKGVDRSELLQSLRQVMRGEMLISSRDLLRSIRASGRDAPAMADLATPLSERETEVVRLLADGLSNREIAAMLFVAESTVKTHVEHIVAKLGVSDRIQAAVWAVRSGLADLP